MNFKNYMNNKYEMVFNKEEEQFILYQIQGIETSSPKVVEQEISKHKIGTTFCDILNKSEEIITSLNKCLDTLIDGNLENEIINKASSTLLSDLIKINPCLEIIGLEYSENLKECKISQLIPNFCILISFSENAILKYREIIFNNFSKDNNIFTLNEDKVKLSMSNCLIEYSKKEENEDILHKKLHTQNYIKSYRYNIKCLKDLLDVSFYQIMLQNFHIRKCRLCGRCFCGKSKQNRCNNISLINPNKTCYEIKENTNENWDNDLNIYANKEKSMLQVFTYYSNKEKNKLKSQNIRENRQLFKKAKKAMKKRISAFFNNDEYKLYLEYYKDYLNIVSNMIYKERNFNIKRITKEYLSNMGLNNIK